MKFKKQVGNNHKHMFQTTLKIEAAPMMPMMGAMSTAAAPSQVCSPN